MKKLKYILIFTLLIGFSFAQRIGELAPDKPPMKFPPNAWGVDLMFSEGGFGLGTFFRKSFDHKLTGFVDFSISESKEDREIEYVDFFGNRIVRNKKNRALLMPLNFGVQYRLFTESLTDNFRPYLTGAVGPSMVLESPFLKNGKQIDFFEAFKYARMKYTVGGYVGIGSDIGISPSHLLSLSLRYYIVHLMGEGIESLDGKFRKNLSSVYISISIGMRY